jgi:type I restriction enzyme S subunit
MKVERIHDAEDHLTRLGAVNGTRLVPENTILFVVRGMILARDFPVALTKRQVAFNQDLKAAKPADFIDTEFLFHWFRANSYEILGRADEAGHGTKRLQTDRLLALPISVPALTTQRRIASILSAYDDLIENSQRRIKILESIARALYREWFVHFRFPGHENHPRVASPLGEIPEGWDVGTLENLVVLQRGFDLPKSSRKDGNVPIIAATGVTGFHDEAKVKAPGVVTGRSGTIGEVMYIHEDFWPLNTALWAKEFPKSEPLVAYYLLSSLDLKQFNSGAAVPTLNRNDVHGINVSISPIELQRQFQQVAGGMHTHCRKLALTVDNLRRTRDLLLPRLLSGQIAPHELEAA